MPTESYSKGSDSLRIYRKADFPAIIQQPDLFFENSRNVKKKKTTQKTKLIPVEESKNEHKLSNTGRWSVKLPAELINKSGGEACWGIK